MIGAFYYTICFAILYRLFSLPVASQFRTLAIALTLLIMLIDGVWNWFFFRTRNLYHALVLGGVYTALALLLLLLLFGVDRGAAWWLAPYVVYLGYANVWGYALWKLNRVLAAPLRN